MLPGETSLEDVFPTQFEKDLYLTTADFGGRTWRAQAVDERARVMKAHQNNIYAYRFDWCGPAPFDFVLGGTHGLDLFFFFGMKKGMYDIWSPESDTPGRKELVDIMMTYLSNFVLTGNPNGWDVPVWQEWSNISDGPKVVLLDADDNDAKVEMSYDEVFIQAERIALRNQIATWPLMKQIQYGLVPYMLPLIYMQLQPAQIDIDLGLFGMYTWNTGQLMRWLMVSAMASGMINAELP